MSAAANRASIYGEHPSSADEAHEYDVCIIGSGAAGAVAASELVEAGLDVLMVEQGPFAVGRTYDEVLRLSEPAYARDVNGCWSLRGYPWSTCNVGGGTVFYGGAAFRHREVDFDASSHFEDADLPVAWPYDYAELASYYEEIEDIVGVAHSAGEDPTAPPGPARSELPAVRASPAGRLVAGAARSLGLRPFPTPVAIATAEHRGRHACVPEHPCMERACASGSKGDAYTVFLRPLEGRPNFRLLAGLKGVRLRRSRPDRVDALDTVRVDTGTRHSFNARSWVIACNAIQSAALLLRSGDDRTPAGLGNERDMVGRGLCFKLNEYVLGYLPDSEPTAERDDDPAEGAGPFSTVALTDYYLDAESPTGMGGLIYENRLPFRYAIRDRGRVMRLECLIADQPSRENRILLSTERDRLDLPYVVLDYQTHPRDAARLEHMVERMDSLLRATGARWIRRVPTEYSLGSCHLHGTCRAGDDPTTSVIDRDSRVHTLDNAYVLDGSFMPFPAAVNPTLTIQAHALRAARRIASLASG